MGQLDLGPVRTSHAATLPLRAARSPLIQLLEDGHEGVTLRAEERHKLAAWIDLLVPYCGDYTEANAWNESERAKYAHFTQKRLRMKRAEEQNIAEYLGAKAEKHGRPNPYRNTAVKRSGEQSGTRE